MKKLLFLAIVGICVLSAGVITYYAAIRVNPRERMRLALADELGVSIDDYPYKTSFPSGYFATILQPGMKLGEVHTIVQGYEQVLHCGDRSEIYYYFSAELKDAKRFKLRYDDQGNFSGFEGEEDDSRSLQTDGCVAGIIIR